MERDESVRAVSSSNGVSPVDTIRPATGSIQREIIISLYERKGAARFRNGLDILSIIFIGLTSDAFMRGGDVVKMCQHKT